MLRRDLMDDLQLYGMTNLALGEYRTFKQRSLNLLSISAAKELGIEMSLELVAGAYAVRHGRCGPLQPAPIADRSARCQSKSRSMVTIACGFHASTCSIDTSGIGWHAARHCGDGAVEPRRTIDDDKFRPLQTAPGEVASTLGTS